MSAPHELETAIALVAELASCRIAVLHGFAALPGARLVAPSGDFARRRGPFVELPGRGVCVGPVRHGRVVVSAAWLERGRAAEDLALVLDEDGGVAGGELPPGAAAAARQAAPCTIRVDGARLMLRWSQLTTEEPRIAAGVRLLELLTAPAGVYR
jgi:hypothetical protein